MPDCIALTREMLISPRRLTVTTNDLTFSAARAMADEEAFRISPEAMLLAWYDRKAGAVSPRVQ